MTEREKRLAEAMIEAVAQGDYLPRYVVIALEDSTRYGWVSQEAKEYIIERVYEEV